MNNEYHIINCLIFWNSWQLLSKNIIEASDAIHTIQHWNIYIPTLESKRIGRNIHGNLIRTWGN